MTPLESLAATGKAPPPSALEIFQLTTVAGGLAGILNVLILGYRHRVLGTFVWAGPDIVWMAPLSYALYLSVLAGGLVVLRWLWPSGVTRPAVVFACVLPTAGALLLVLFQQRMHPLAVLILATGIATMAARGAQRFEVTLHRRIRALTYCVVGLMAGLAVGIPAQQVLHERLSLAWRDPARRGVPNVLIIILDTVRAASLGLYGYGRNTTPRLTKWARRGVVFDFAVSTAPWTLPSHGSIFTGQLHNELEVNWMDPLDQDEWTLAEFYRQQGYRTGGFVANFYYASRESGLAQGFDHYEDYPRTLRQFALSSMLGQVVDAAQRGRLPGKENQADRKDASRVADEFLTWVVQDSTRPFFAFLNFFDAHRPYTAPDSIARFGSGRAPIDRYDASIAFMDQEVGALLDQLDRGGLLANTLVIVTSDHGELFGEHGLSGHANSLYLPLLRVPLLIVQPEEVPPARRVSTPVSLVDLAATIVGETEPTTPPPFPGHSLARYWDSTAADTTGVSDTLSAAVTQGIDNAPDVPVMRGPMNTLVAGHLHYILNGDGKEELYDLARDPNERHNLADEAGAALELAHFRATIRRYVLPGSRFPDDTLAATGK